MNASNIEGLSSSITVANEEGEWRVYRQIGNMVLPEPEVVPVGSASSGPCRHSVPACCHSIPFRARWLWSHADAMRGIASPRDALRRGARNDSGGVANARGGFWRSRARKKTGSRRAPARSPLPPAAAGGRGLGRGGPQVHQRYLGGTGLKSTPPPSGGGRQFRVCDRALMVGPAGLEPATNRL